MMKPAEEPGPGPVPGAGRTRFRDGIVKYAGILSALFLTVGCIIAGPFLEPPFLLSLLVIVFSGILYLIRGTRAISISILVLAILYGLGGLSLFIFLATLGIVAVGEIAYRASAGGHHRYLTYIAASSAGAGLVTLYLAWVQHLERVEPILLLLLLLLGVLVAVLLKSVLQGRTDLLMVESLGVAMTMYLFEDIHYQVPVLTLLIAALIAFSFGYFAYRLRVADLSGLFSGALVGIIIIVFTYVPYDVRWFLVMLAFLVLGTASTRYRYEVKAAAGIAESHGGVRGYMNVFANGLVGVIAAVLFGLSGGSPLPAALYLGSIATAAADTMGGEIGMTSRDPVLITTLERVPKGTNGGITLLGEAASLGAAAAIAISAFLLGIGDLRMLLSVTLAGFFGSNVDSVVGALFENRGLVGNAGTNLIATLAGGLAALALFLVLR
jgi:uncharacterized protein (TIGR00297 family)